MRNTSIGRAAAAWLCAPLLLITSPEAVAQDAAGTRNQHRDVRVLEVSGTPYERGLAHGRELKAEIRELLAAFTKDLEKSYGRDAKTVIERFLAHTDFQPAIEKWTPGLLDEVRGIAVGAEVSFDELYAFQLADEFWSMGSWAMRDKCTAIAVSRRGEQPTLVAQNMDVPGFYHKYPMLLRVRYDDQPDAMVLTCPGLIGLNGMNSVALAVCCNTLLQLRPSRQGVPCLFVVRGLLEQKDIASAEAWLKRIPHAVGQNYTIGDPTGAKAFECSAGDKVQFVPHEDADFTYHTNHPLVNTDWHPDYLAKCTERGREPEQGLRVCHRFESLAERIRPGERIGVDTIQNALASRDNRNGPICGEFNYACTIFVLTREPKLLMAPGRPDHFAFQEFAFGR